MSYDDRLTLRQARAQYFMANGFGDGGYEDSWVKLQAGPIPLYFPNSAQRVRAVRFHDLHHVLTEYDTTWTGEAEIGAWEVASGCADHYAAWLLNLEAMAVGLIVAPGAVRNAFLRGRQCRNLYRARFDDVLLDRTVGELRGELSINEPSEAGVKTERAAFFGWSFVALGVLALSLLLPMIALGGLIWGGIAISSGAQ